MRQTIDRARERSKGNETGKSRTIQGQGTVSGQSDSMEREQEQVMARLERRSDDSDDEPYRNRER